MKKCIRAVFLFLFFGAIPVHPCHAASVNSPPPPLRGHDHIIYRGIILRLDSSSIYIKIHGPVCAGQRQFKRDGWAGQGAHSVGDKINFILSGDCTDVNTVLTVESGGKSDVQF
jgi:hypothetical protein